MGEAVALRGPIALGDYLGTLRYFGACTDCRTQFMSSSDRVYYDTDTATKLCVRCGERRMKTP